MKSLITFLNQNKPPPINHFMQLSNNEKLVVWLIGIINLVHDYCYWPFAFLFLESVLAPSWGISHDIIGKWLQKWTKTRNMWVTMTCFAVPWMTVSAHSVVWKVPVTIFSVFVSRDEVCVVVIVFCILSVYILASFFQHFFQGSFWHMFVVTWLSWYQLLSAVIKYGAIFFGYICQKEIISSIFIAVCRQVQTKKHLFLGAIKIISSVYCSLHWRLLIMYIYQFNLVSGQRHQLTGHDIHQIGYPAYLQCLCDFYPYIQQMFTNVKEREIPSHMIHTWTVTLFLYLF